MGTGLEFIKTSLFTTVLITRNGVLDGPGFKTIFWKNFLKVVSTLRVELPRINHATENLTQTLNRVVCGKVNVFGVTILMLYS